MWHLELGGTVGSKKAVLRFSQPATGRREVSARSRLRLAEFFTLDAPQQPLYLIAIAQINPTTAEFAWRALAY